MPSIQSSPIMNVPQTCTYLGVGRDLLYTLAARNEIPHFHVGRYLRFRLDDLDQWSRSHEHHRSDLYRTRKPIQRAR